MDLEITRRVVLEEQEVEEEQRQQENQACIAPQTFSSYIGKANTQQPDSFTRRNNNLNHFFRIMEGLLARVLSEE